MERWLRKYRVTLVSGFSLNQVSLEHHFVVTVSNVYGQGWDIMHHAESWCKFKPLILRPKHTESSVPNVGSVRPKHCLIVFFLFYADDGSAPDRVAQIMGPPDQAQHAADIITDLLRSVQAGGPPGHGGGRGRGRGQGNWNMGPPGGLQEFSFSVPTMKTGLIIGKGLSSKLIF